MKLPTQRRCPIHNRTNCCGREDRKKRIANARHVQIAPGVTKILDEHHPRGFRIHRSKAAMRDLLMRKVKEQNGKCYWQESTLCPITFKDFREVTPDHIQPRCMGASWRDDDESNVAASCAYCNHDKGSRRDWQPKPTESAA